MITCVIKCRNACFQNAVTICYNVPAMFPFHQVLRKLTASKEERDTLSEVASMLTPLKNKLKLAVQNAGPAAKRKPGFV